MKTPSTFSQNIVVRCVGHLRRIVLLLVWLGIGIHAAQGVNFTNVWSVLKQGTAATGADSSYRVARDTAGNVFVMGTTNDGAAAYATVQKFAAADGALLWEKHYSGQQGALIADAAGDVIVVGSLEAATSDIYAAKYSGANGTLLWSRTYNGNLGSSFDIATQVALDAAGNVALAGISADNSGNYDFYTAKYAAADGAVIWERRYDHGSSDEPQAIATDSAGNVIVAGYSYGTGVGTDYYTAKYAAADGALVWERRYSTANYDSLSAMCVDSSDNVIVTGGSGSDVYTAKYAALTGAIQWEVRYVPASDFASGNGIAVDSSGNVFVSGIIAINGNWDILTLKYNSSGVQQWVKTYDGSASGTDFSYGITLDATGNPLIVGSIVTTTGGNDIYAVKRASDTGNVVWERIYDDPSHGSDTGYGIAIGAGSTVAITGPTGTGRSDNDTYTALLNIGDGTPVWEQIHAGDFLRTEAAVVVKVDAASDVIVAGRTNDASEFSSDGDVDFYTAKHSGLTGALIWEKRYGSASHGEERIKDMALDSNGNVIITGESPSDADGFNRDFYTAKYASTDGAMLWERRYDSGEGYDIVSGVAVDQAGNVIVAGSIYVGGQYNWYTAKYAAADGAVLWETTFNGPGNSYDEAFAVTVDSAGNAIVAGYASMPGYKQNIHTIKYAAANGAVLWSRSVTPASEYGRAMLLAVDPSDNVCVSGINYTGDSVSRQDIYTAKYAAADGAVLWQQNYNGPGNLDDESKAIAVDASGNVVITGGSWNATDSDFYTAKYAAADGALIWERRYNGPAALDDAATALRLDSAGNVFITGPSMNATHAEFYTALYAASNGAIMWDARRGTTNRHDVPAALAVDASNNIVAAGGSWASFNIYDGGHDEGDLLLVKYVHGGPDIAVTGNSTDIADGDSTPGTADHTDFGSVAAASGTIVRTYTILNNGTENLTLGTITVDGTNASDFTVTSAPVSPVTPGNSTTFQVTFDPGAIGLRTATLSFTNNDTGKTPFDFSIQGTGTNSAPTDVSLSAASIAENNAANATVGTFSATDPDSGDSHSFTFVTGTGDTDNGSFTIVGAALKLTPSANFETKSSYAIRVRATDAGTLTFDKAFTITITDVNEAPTNISLSAASITENNAANATVGNLSATDPDSGDSHSFTLVTGTGDADNGSFTIVGSALKLTPSANFEVKNSYSVRVRATDGGTLTFDKAFTITITNVNEAPTDIGLSATSIAENNAANATVGTLSATDPDSGDSHSFTLVTGTGDTDNGNFTIVGGALKLTPSADFESKSSYAIRVRATDAGTLTFDKAFTITITDVEEAPTDIALSASSIVENNAANATVGTLSAADPDSSDSHSFTLVTGNGDTDNGSFTIVGTALKLTPSANFEVKSSYAIRVRTTDSGTPEQTFEKQFTITITDVNEAPTDIALSATSIVENNAANATVGNLSATDPDSGDSHSFTLVTGTGDADNGSFTIVGSALKLTPSANFEVKNSYAIRVRTTDAGTLSYEKQFTITITDVNLAPTDISLSATSIAENNAANATVGTFSATDLDSGDSHSFALVSGTGDDDNGSFTIVGTALKLTPSANFEVKSSYAIRVRTTDSGAPGLTFEKQFTISITDVNESPTITDITDRIIAKGGTTGAISFTVGDVDATASLTVSGTSSNTTLVPNLPANISFGGSGASRTVTVTPVATQTGTATITVTVSDGTLSASDTFVLTVSASEIVVEQPAGTSLVDGTATVNFGNVNTGTPTPLTFILKNTGTGDLSGLAFNAHTGTNAADFTVSALVSTLAPGASTTFTVTFNPAAAGARTAAIHIASNDVDESPFDINLSGTGVAAPEIVVEQPADNNLTDGTATVNFGTVNTGTPSPLTFTVRNTGTINLTGLAFNAKTGTNAADFTVGALGATTLAPGASTTFTVTFNPTAGGARTAAIHLASNDADENPFDINLSGTGVSVPEISVEQPALTILADNSPTPVEFGNTPVDNPTLKIFTIRNLGGLSLTGVAITSIDGADAANFTVTVPPAATIIAGGSTTFTVRFAPSVTSGVKTAALHITSNDADENPFDIALQGTATPAAGVLSFNTPVNASGFAFNEPATTNGTAIISVKRTGGTEGDVTVNVSTTNGTALAGISPAGDYTALTNVPVTILAGQSTGSTTVILRGADAVEVNETFTVTLSSPAGLSGAGAPTLGPVVSAPVTIIDPSALSTVLDTAVPSAPVITTPAAAAFIGVNTAGTLTLVGTAADNKGVQLVQVSLNGGSFTDAVLGTLGAPSTSFTFALLPITGLNTVQVKSTDYANRVSTVTTRSFTVTRPLAVNFSGPGTGTVTAGFAPSSFREVGKGYTITATPTAAAAPGFAFNGWTVSGGPSLSDIGVTAGALELPTLTFIYHEGLVLTANFIVNPFASAVTGAFNGLITPSATLPSPGASVRSNETVGKVTATVGGTGGLSGTLFIDGMSLGFAGVFDNTGTARFGTNRATTFSVVRTTKPSYDLALHLDLDPSGTNKITGTLTQKVRGIIKSVSTLDADRAFYNATAPKVPANLAGTTSKAYTVVFTKKGLVSQPAGFTLADFPQGDGYATVSVNVNGTVTIAGNLADGTPINTSAPLSKANTWPLFQQLYPVLNVKQGSIAGMVTLDDTQAETDLAGTNVLWFRPFQLVQWYPYGWDEGIVVDVLGAKYDVPPALPATSVFPGPGNPAGALKAVDLVNGNVGATFSDGLLSGSITRSVNISPTNAVTKPTTNTDANFTLSLTSSSGVLSGAFTHTDGTKPTFQGVIIQKGTQRGAFGYFMTKQPAVIDYTGESGGVTLFGQP